MLQNLLVRISAEPPPCDLYCILSLFNSISVISCIHVHISFSVVLFMLVPTLPSDAFFLFCNMFTRNRLYMCALCMLYAGVLICECCRKHIYFHHIHSTCSSIHQFSMDVIWCGIDTITACYYTVGPAVYHQCILWWWQRWKVMPEYVCKSVYKYMEWILFKRARKTRKYDKALGRNTISM